MSMGWGFRWFKINNYIYVYVATTLHDEFPFSQVLAYVQQTRKEGVYRGLRSIASGVMLVPVPQGGLEETMAKTEEFILNDPFSKDFRSLNNSGIEEGLQN